MTHPSKETLFKQSEPKPWHFSIELLGLHDNVPLRMVRVVFPYLRCTH